LAERVPARLSPAEGRKFGLTVGIAFLVLAGLLYFWRHKETIAAVIGGLGALLVLASLAVPTRLGPLQRAWMGLAHALSKVTTPVFMGIVYFFVLGPTGLVMRLFGKNPLVANQRDGSVWAVRADRKGDMQRQF